jgi:hypothetical protein
MDDQAAMPRPDRFRYGPFEEWRNDQIRPKQGHSLLGHGIGYVELDADFVATRRQLAIKALCQAVEPMGNEENSHVFTVLYNSCHKAEARQDKALRDVPSRVAYIYNFRDIFQALGFVYDADQ